MQDFKAVEIKIRERSRFTHTIFIKQHMVREKCLKKPAHRTLFILGIPPYVNENCLLEFFQQFGKIDDVFLHQTPTSQLPQAEESVYFKKYKPIRGYKVAYVVFSFDKGLKTILKKNFEKPLVLCKSDANLDAGPPRWCKEYNKRFPDIKLLNEEIESYMQEFDQAADSKNKMDKKLGEADEDGWVTVTRKGKRPGFARKESVRNQILQKDANQRKKKELVNFYRFQIREAKMKNLIALRQKFEEDKKKIAALKQTRKFKPF